MGRDDYNYRAWIVINNQTLTIFMDGEDYNTVYRSYDLYNIKVVKEKDEKCIRVNEVKKTKIVSMTVKDIELREDVICIVEENIKESAY